MFEFFWCQVRGVKSVHWGEREEPDWVFFCIGEANGGVECLEVGLHVGDDDEVFALGFSEEDACGFVDAACLGLVCDGAFSSCKEGVDCGEESVVFCGVFFCCFRGVDGGWWDVSLGLYGCGECCEVFEDGGIPGGWFDGVEYFIFIVGDESDGMT